MEPRFIGKEYVSILQHLRINIGHKPLTELHSSCLVHIQQLMHHTTVNLYARSACFRIRIVVDWDTCNCCDKRRDGFTWTACHYLRCVGHRCLGADSLSTHLSLNQHGSGCTPFLNQFLHMTDLAGGFAATPRTANAKYLLEREFESKHVTVNHRHGSAQNEKVDLTLTKATARWASSAICETIFKISLNVKQGRLCAVIGPPGSGKRFGRLLTARSSDPMRVIEVSMEQRRNETGDPRETRRPMTSSGTIPTCENPSEGLAAWRYLAAVQREKRSMPLWPRASSRPYFAACACEGEEVEKSYKEPVPKLEKDGEPDNKTTSTVTVLSSLLQAILGELPLSSGTVSVGGNISYASQEPWLFVGTVRQNILFGQPYEPKRYKEVVRVCALQRDFEVLPNGDKTIVSERGVFLSTGQRARINMARAVYRRSDIYLLDDPLSKVDAHIGQHILEDCICSHISNKTRIIITSQLQCVKKADHIVVMNNGHIEIQGTLQELQNNKLNFDTILSSSDTEAEEQVRGSLAREISNISVQNSTGDYDEEAAGGEGPGEDAGLLGGRSSKMEACVGYLRSVGGGAYIAGLVAILLLCQVATSGADYWVATEETRGMYAEFKPEDIYQSLANSTWNSSGAAELDYRGQQYLSEPTLELLNVSSANGSEWGSWPAPDLSDDTLNGTGPGVPLARDTSLYVYAACVGAAVILTVARSLLFLRACVAASCGLHSALCHGVLRASMQSFHSVPPERILNRFSSDFAAIDGTLPRTLTEAFQIFSVIIGALILMIITNYILIVPMVFVAAAIYKMRNIFTRTIQAMRRLERTTCGPVLTHLSTTLDGLSTIRASASQDVMATDFHTYQDFGTIDEDFDTTDEDFDTIDEDFDTVDEDFDTVDEDFDTVDEDFDTVDEDFDTIDEDFDTIDEDFYTTDEDFDTIHEYFDTIDEDFDTTDESMDPPTNNFTILTAKKKN
ncbi:hypothetical protein PR048_028112 [Dryococelus australis]|uniref:Uncharacterized protein n=1 Tax=Dryococelus australis TaxID=614101 RepID=A0ABQ9GIA9_9NEOP|nr:hypothetical protein PR048_028112 [Dryococelus australis]